MHFTVEFSIIQVHFDNDILKDVIKGILQGIKNLNRLKNFHMLNLLAVELLTRILLRVLIQGLRVVLEII